MWHLRSEEQPLTLIYVETYINHNKQIRFCVRLVAIQMQQKHTHLSCFFAVIQTNVLKCFFHFFPRSSNS